VNRVYKHSSYKDEYLSPYGDGDGGMKDLKEEDHDED
jgi:hypothetical protein